MQFNLHFVLQCIYLIVPAAFANMSPVLAKNLFKFLAVPVDFNRQLWKKPIFGSHKTWRGIIMAVFFGTVFFALQKYLYQFGFFQQLSIINYAEQSVFLGSLIGFGAIFGDLVKSFFKRRVNIKPGNPWIPFDQMDFILGAFLFMAILYIPSLQVIVTTIIIAVLGHMLINNIGYYLGIRKVRW